MSFVSHSLFSHLLRHSLFQTRSWSLCCSIPTHPNEAQGLQTSSSSDGPLPHPDQMNSSPDGKPKFEKISRVIPVVHDRSVQRTPDFLQSYMNFNLQSFLPSLKTPQAGCPAFLRISLLIPGFQRWGNQLKCSLLGVSIDFSLSTLNAILNLPNVGEFVFLSSNDKFGLLSHTEIYSTIL